MSETQGSADTIRACCLFLSRKTTLGLPAQITFADVSSSRVRIFFASTGIDRIFLYRYFINALSDPRQLLPFLQFVVAFCLGRL